MNKDFLYHWLSFPLIHDTVIADICRLTIAVISTLVAALLAKLYFKHKTGKMNSQVAWGSVLVYISIAYAQLIAIASNSSLDFTLLNLLVLVSVSLSLSGTLKVMRVNLFVRREGDISDA